MTIRTLIVDDEPLARERIRSLLLKKSGWRCWRNARAGGRR